MNHIWGDLVAGHDRMAKSMERFAVSEKGFALPVNDVLTGRGFVTGKSGSGKSNTASVVAEELLERGVGLMIVDTDGEYAALKERYELLQVGGDESCDREVSPEDAPLIVDLALEENVPIILDVSGYMDEELANDVIFAVVRELFVAEKTHQKPFLLFVEEAHEFIPERGGGDDVHKMLVRVAKRGRKRGLGIVAMSQRPAAVSKDYITQCDWLVWHRLTWENDTKVAGRILGGDAADSVQSLDDGEALVMTDWDEKISRVQFRRKKTVDEGSTPTLREAYGPPSEREAHLTQSEDTGDADDGETDTGDEGETTGSETTENDADGESGTEEPGEATSAGGELHEDEETAVKGGGGGGSTKVDDGSGPGTDWDLSELDIEPRRRAPAVTDRRGSQAGAPPGETAMAEHGGATGVGTATPASQHAVEPADATVPATVIDGSGSPGQIEEPALTPAKKGPTQTRRLEFDEPDEWDPVWEFGQFIVYCYAVLVGIHRRPLKRLDRAFLGAFVATTHRVSPRTRRPEPGRGLRRVARTCSIVTLVGCYVGLITALVLVAGAVEWPTVA